MLVNALLRKALAGYALLRKAPECRPSCFPISQSAIEPNRHTDTQTKASPPPQVPKVSFLIRSGLVACPVDARDNNNLELN